MKLSIVINIMLQQEAGLLEFGILILFLFLFYQQKTPDTSSVIVFPQNTSQ